jgi:hypothetical protein
MLKGYFCSIVVMFKGYFCSIVVMLKGYFCSVVVMFKGYFGPGLGQSIRPHAGWVKGRGRKEERRGEMTEERGGMRGV